ncbi:hypothetical protein QA639_22845 [Bradyrhizobium pachyrhizi]|uniref:hypothetical protein n=1 Tax=Bradyrhizobium pachyrhizi TaxID=280333 RepID=UPI0024B1AFF1|nr:hypothetical protein [Bradyrhizobium pachyrhizi]WFU52540.1 hypothetical protein QA639_22845 [Bradyrhizobium pachyrhizi]
MDSELVQGLLDAILDSYKDVEGLVLVRHAPQVADDLFVLRIIHDPDHPASSQIVFRQIFVVGASKHSVRIQIEHGPRIVYHGYPIQGDPNDPLGPNFPSKPTGAPYIGGDRVANRRGTMWGTLGVAVHGIQMQHSGTSCGTNAACFLSNNHVIALSNGGVAGDPIYELDTATEIGNLHCFIPMKNAGGTDAALATLFATNVAWGQLSGLGQIRGEIGKLHLGMIIYKAGGRTGTNEGNYLGVGNVNVDGRWFYGAGITSRQFGCRGDSGSLVVDGSRALIGLYFAGEDLPCDQRPEGFFIPFQDMRSVSQLLGIEITLGKDESSSAGPVAAG